MSLDVYLQIIEPVTVYENNITHNLGTMANAADPLLYKALWRPDELFEHPKAGFLIPYLEQGLKKLNEDPGHFRQYESPNGWGTHEGLSEFITKYLDACKAHPNTDVKVSR
jgi:hypothetical protein